MATTTEAPALDLTHYVLGDHMLPMIGAVKVETLTSGMAAVEDRRLPGLGLVKVHLEVTAVCATRRVVFYTLNTGEVRELAYGEMVDVI